MNQLTENELDRRRLMKALVGLSVARPVISGFGTKALARVAGIKDHRVVTDLAKVLADRGLIAFEQGSARRTHAYRVLVEVPQATRAQAATLAESRLHDALKRKAA